MFSGKEFGQALARAIKVKSDRDPSFGRKTLAADLGVTIQAISLWINTGQIRQENIIKVINYFKDTLPNDFWGMSDDEKRFLEKRADFVPLVSNIPVGSITDILNETATEFVPCPVKHSSNCFALKVSGISMMNGENGVSFMPGSIVFIDKDREPMNGDYVVALHNEEATLKQYFREFGKTFLRALNPSWQPRMIEVTTDTAIEGVVIAKLETF